MSYKAFEISKAVAEVATQNMPEWKVWDLIRQAVELYEKGKEVG